MTRANEAKLANLLDREFDGYAPHTHPASDLTYVRVGSGWAYVCLLVGLTNRGIAGHSAGRTRDAGLMPAAFATLDFPLTDVQVFHTDRGSGFDNTGIDEPLDVFGIKRSLSRKGNPYDNAVVESTDRLIDAKGYSDVDVYKRANINRKLFSKIRCGDGYMPSKKTVLALAIALRLNIDETQDILACAGYALSHSVKFDVIVEFFIVHEMFDVFTINEMLFRYEQPLLGQ